MQFCSNDGPSVCGRDGITYENECSLGCAQILEALDASCCSSCDVVCTEFGIDTFSASCDTACGIVPGNLLPCANVSLVTAAPEIGVLVAVGASLPIDYAFVAFDLSDLPSMSEALLKPNGCFFFLRTFPNFFRAVQF